VPEAATEKVAACPDTIVWLAGCMVTRGATAPAFTVTVVEALMAPEVAVITEVPAAIALNTPEELMVATAELAELQVAVEDRFCVLLLL
jgi:hypothetical protein